MRRRSSEAAGILAASIAVASIALTGCGGSGDSRAPDQPRPGALRDLVKRTLDSELEKQDAPAAEIACVGRNVVGMPERVIAEEVVRASDPQKESEAESLGRFGRGCL